MIKFAGGVYIVYKQMLINCKIMLDFLKTYFINHQLIKLKCQHAVQSPLKVKMVNF